MVKQRVSKRILLNRKLDSRETSASILCSLLRLLPVLYKEVGADRRVNAMKTRNQEPIDDWPKACTN